MLGKDGAFFGDASNQTPAEDFSATSEWLSGVQLCSWPVGSALMRGGNE